MARRYDVQTDSILFVTNQPYSRDSYNSAGMGEIVEDLLRFCRMMYAMKVDNAEYALLTAIVIFSGLYFKNSIKLSFLLMYFFSNCRTTITNRRLEGGKNSRNLLGGIKSIC